MESCKHLKHQLFSSSSPYIEVSKEQEFPMEFRRPDTYCINMRHKLNKMSEWVLDLNEIGLNENATSFLRKL